jgi:hypothetical protein
MEMTALYDSFDKTETVAMAAASNAAGTLHTANKDLATTVISQSCCCSAKLNRKQNVPARAASRW